MSVAPALTNAENAALAGPSVPRWYLVFDTTSGNTVGTARVNAPGGLTYPLTSLPVDGQSANWGNILPDQTVLIGSTPGGFDRGIYRVRWDAFLNFPTLEIMAIGQNDSGEINIALRNTVISDDDYVTVLDRFDPFGKFPRIQYSGIGLDATIWEDWDDGVFTANRYPPGIANVTIDGQSANYAAHIFSGSSKTFDISASIILWPTSSSATWDWVLPAGWTLNSGALSGSGLTNTINVTAPHSADTYTLQFHVQDDNGINWVAYRKVWIKSFTYPPLDLVRIDSHVDDRTGSKWTVTLNKLVGMPPGAMVHLFNAGTWNGVDVPTASKCFTGYVQRRREVTDIGVANVSLDLVGPSYLLELIGGQSQIMSAVNAVTTNWQQVYYLLSYLDFIIWWVLYNRASGMLQMFNYTSFGLTNTQKRMTDWRIDAGTLLAQLKALAVRYCGGNFGCDPTGEFMLRVHPSRIPWSSRSGIPIRAQLNAGLYKGAELQYEEHPQVRRLRGECFVSDGLTTDTPYWCDAPIIPGQGAREEKLERLICDSTDEFYEVTGDDFQARNNPYPSGTVQLRNYAVIYPAQMSRVGLDIAPALRYDGQEYTGYVIATQVSYTHNPDGTIDTTLSVEAETVGLPATDVPVPTLDPSTLNSFYQSVPFAPVPSYRSPNPNPAGTKKGARVVPKDGSVGFTGSPTHAYLVLNALGTPIYRDVTPSTLGSFQIQHGMVVPGGTRAYLLGYDGTNSAVWTTPNLFASPKPTWSKGANIAGQYTLIEPASSAPGTVLIYNPATAASGWKKTFDFKTGAQGWTARDPGGTGSNLGVWSAGNGWTTSDQNYGGLNVRGMFIAINIPATDLTRMTATFDQSNGTLGNPTSPNQLLEDTVSFVSNIPANNVLGTNVIVSGTGAGTASTLVAAFFFCHDDVSPWSGSITIHSITVYGTGTCPFSGCDPAGSGTAAAAASTDNGATWGSPLTFGTGLVDVIGGFDVQRGGTVSYAESEGQVNKASTLGGAYSSYATFSANPLLIEIPWGTKNSRSANSGSSPQVIVGLDQPDGSNHTLFWYVAGSPVNITPVIGGNPGIFAGPSSLCTWLGLYVGLLANFGGAKHLVASADGGSTWLDRGPVNASYLRLRRLSKTPGQLFMVGPGLFVYSPDFGATKIAKALPPSSNLIFYEPVG